MDIKKIDGGITAAGGYKAAGLSCGIKKSGKKDLALVYSEVPAVGAAVFTKNHFKAAPVILSIEKMKNETIRAILINSGNANACTGEKGKEDAVNLISLTAEKLNINDDEVHMSSTGIIGEFLPVDIIREGIEEIATMLDKSGSSQAAEAIMTTDKVKKEIAYSFKLPSDGITVKVGGMAKGSGMIHPNMATMLGFITTDISITKELLQKALSEVVDHSFNKISVDGDQSTNDSVFLMANAEASNQKITEENEDYNAFVEVLKKVSVYLAKAIVLDGEGATRFITIKVSGAVNYEEADLAARKVANSNLVKTACFGGDPNWGRIVAVLGSCDIDVDTNKVGVTINNKLLFNEGIPINLKKEEMSDLMIEKEILIEVNLEKGNKEVEFWTSDLTYDYVKINAEYHT
ncbi:MAG: bifunctional glutamate N-acetyltransferase/amino-acid acetyltransferase ArgJ [Halanaerobiaceae bacterium]